MLPDEVLMTIVDHLNCYQSVFALSQTSQRLHCLAIDYLCQKKSVLAIFHCIDNGHQTILSRLIEQPGPPLVKDTLNNMLLRAESKGHRGICEMLLRACKSINADNRTYLCALMSAAQGGFAHVTKLVLHVIPDDMEDHKIDGCDYRTAALRISSEKGHEEVVRLLLDAGAPANDNGDRCVSAIQMAAQEGHEEIVRVLLQAGGDVNSNQNVFYPSPLQLASGKGHMGLVKLLLEAGASIDVSAGFDGTALQRALKHGHQDVVKLLLEAGASDQSS